jgi:hypothetical protein
MAKLEYDLSLLTDGTIKIRVGRQREYIGSGGKTKAEIFEAIKWALISKGVYVSEARLTEDLYGLLRSKDGAS